MRLPAVSARCKGADRRVRGVVVSFSAIVLRASAAALRRFAVAIYDGRVASCVFAVASSDRAGALGPSSVGSCACSAVERVRAVPVRGVVIESRAFRLAEHVHEAIVRGPAVAVRACKVIVRGRSAVDCVVAVHAGWCEVAMGDRAVAPRACRVALRRFRFVARDSVRVVRPEVDPVRRIAVVAGAWPAAEVRSGSVLRPAVMGVWVCAVRMRVVRADSWHGGAAAWTGQAGCASLQRRLTVFLASRSRRAASLKFPPVARTAWTT